MSSVRIHRVSNIGLPTSPSFISSNIALSSHDLRYIPFLPVKRLFFYPASDLDHLFSIIASLKSSLANILASFHVLAGKLTFDPSSKLVFIDCSGEAVGEGIAFHEAVSDDLDFDSLSKEEVPDVEAFRQLVPDISGVELPLPVFATQVTKFPNGGVALGIAIHHAVMDGNGLWQFIHAWASNCKKEGAPMESVPIHNRSHIISHVNNEMYKAILEDTVPNLPKIGRRQDDPFWQGNNNLSRRTFTIDKNAIETLKQTPLSMHPSRASTPSTFVSLITHAWIALTPARVSVYGSQYTTSHMFLPIDIRAHLDPPVDQSYTGNCLSVRFIQMSCSELLGPNGFTDACDNIKHVITECRRNPLSSITKLRKDYEKISIQMAIWVAASPKFKVYDTDFGWGKPNRVELASMSSDGIVAMVAGREEGTVQISVCLTARFMDPFVEYFTNGHVA